MKPNSQWVEGVYISEYKARILPFIDDTIGRIIAKPITPQEGVEIAAKLKEYCQAHAKEQVEMFIEGLVKEYEKLVTMLTEKGWDKGDDFQQGQFSMAKNVLAESRTLLRKHTGEEK